ncbi:MAG: hypothetical protein FWB75_01715 [Oscillospiraceae bacterium]|nr:hypothetical protein [Oscillospiraceae bacterium]
MDGFFVQLSRNINFIWIIAFVAAVVIVIRVTRDDFDSLLVMHLWIWLFGGILFLLAGIAGAIGDTGRGWNWAFSGLLIASICSVIATVMKIFQDKLSDYNTSVAIGVSLGVFLPLSGTLGILAFSDTTRIAESQMDQSLAFWVNFFNTRDPMSMGLGELIVFMVGIVVMPPVPLVIMFLILTKIANSVRDDKAEQERFRIQHEEAKAREAQARQEELNNWERRIDSDIAGIFSSRTGLNMSSLNDMLRKHNNDSEEAKRLCSKLLKRLSEIENITKDEIHRRNFSEAYCGLSAILRLKPDAEQYKEAHKIIGASLKNSDALKAVMEKHGLSTKSRYYREFEYEVLDSQTAKVNKYRLC